MSGMPQFTPSSDAAEYLTLILRRRIDQPGCHSPLRIRRLTERDLDDWMSRCDDCDVNIHEIGEYYMVTDELWTQAYAGRPEPHMLCVECLEDRVGRQLCKADFTNAPVNNPKKYSVSELLRERLTAAAA